MSERNGIDWSMEDRAVAINSKDVETLRMAVAFFSKPEKMDWREYCLVKARAYNALGQMCKQFHSVLTSAIGVLVVARITDWLLLAEELCRLISKTHREAFSTDLHMRIVASMELAGVFGSVRKATSFVRIIEQMSQQMELAEKINKDLVDVASAGGLTSGLRHQVSAGTEESR